MNWLTILDRLRQTGASEDSQLAAYERRSSWRVSRRVALLGLRPDGETLNLTALNFGPGGLRLESPRRLHLQEEMTLRVRPSAGVPPGDEVQGVQVRVVWCRKRKDYPTFDLGVQFTGNEEESARLAARFLLDDCGVTIRNPKEKRKAPRASVERMSGIFSTPDGTLINVAVVDLSVTGALIQSPRNLAAGDSVAIKIILAKDIAPLDCKGLVVRCRAGAEPKTFLLGIHFVEVPGDHKDRLVQFLSRQLKLSPAP